MTSVVVRLKVTGADRTRLYWSLQKKCPSPRWKRRASARRKRPPPQMALATGRTESATRAKSPLFDATFVARLKAVPFHRVLADISFAVLNGRRGNGEPFTSRR